MSELALVRTAVWNDALGTLRSGALVAVVGALGAWVGLYLMPLAFAAASLPMSVLGLVLGLHSRTLGAVVIGAVGIACALLALIDSESFWLGFAVLAGTLAAA